MAKTFKLTVSDRTALARSRRLREAGASVYVTGSTVVGSTTTTGITDVTTTGNGNAVTDGSVSSDGKTLILRKGDTFLAEDSAQDMFLRKDQDDATPYQLGMGTAVVEGAATIGESIDIGKDAIIHNDLTVENDTLLRRYLDVYDRITAHGDVQYGDTFETGLLGQGGLFANGYGEMRGLRLWEWLEVPELRYNRVSINTGITWQTFGGGIIESVEVTGDNTGIITLKLEDGEVGAIAEDDLCMGIYHNFDGDNDSESADTHDGNFHFAGFRTIYFRVETILETERKSQFSYVLRATDGTGGSWTQQYHPAAYMHFAAYANPSDTSRQNSIYSTTTYLIALQNMTTWEYGNSNIYYIRGILDGFTVGGTALAGTGIYIGNGYFSGVLQQIENAPYTLSFDLGDGDTYIDTGDTRTLTSIITKAWEDVTASFTTWAITRETGDSAADAAWDAAHTDFAGTIVLSYDDLGGATSALFHITASDGTTTVANSIIFRPAVEGHDAAEVQINILLRTAFTSVEKTREAWSIDETATVVANAVEGRNALCLATTGGYYTFISGVEPSVVVIDGNSVVVAAGEMIQGSFTDDVGITLNNLTDVVIVGNVSLALSSDTGSNSTMQRVSLTYREGYSRDMRHFFYNCTALREVVLRGVAPTRLNSMFRNCSSLVEVDMVDVDMSQCTTIDALFDQCSSLTTVKGNEKFDTSKCTSFNILFRGCSSLLALDPSHWDTSNVTLMGGCFRECSSLTALDLSGWDTSKSTSFQGMFYNDTSLESIAFGDKWDAAAVTDMGSMFSLCSSLTTLTGSVRNIKVDLLASFSPLTRDSALVLINGLYDYAAEGATGGTLTLSAATRQLITAADIQIATDKGWTIA